MRNKYLFSGSIGLLFLAHTMAAHADTLYLKNGRRIEGVVRSSTVSRIALEVADGTVVFRPGEIERIERVSAQGNVLLYERWKRKKEENAALFKKWEEKKNQIRAPQPGSLSSGNLPSQAVYYKQDRVSSAITVDAIINNNLPATLLVDTGASLVVLSKEMGRRLGLDSRTDLTPIELINADGRTAKANYFVLDSVRVEGVESVNVPAAVMLEDSGSATWNDGILGMSFLKEFNIKVDRENNKMILEKARW